MRVAFAGSPARGGAAAPGAGGGRARGHGRRHPARQGARALRRAGADAGRARRRGSWASRCCARGRSTTRRSSSRSRPAARGALAVVAFGQILREGVLSRWPSINVHFSLLPAYRGAAPVERAIMDGVTRTGVTIMQMDAGLDTGPMLARRAIEIGEDEDAGSVTGAPQRARRAAAGGGAHRPRRRPAGAGDPARGGGLAGAQDHARGPRPRPLAAGRRAGPAGPGAVPPHRGDARDRRRALQGLAGARPRRARPRAAVRRGRAPGRRDRRRVPRDPGAAAAGQGRGWTRPPSCAAGAARWRRAPPVAETATGGIARERSVALRVLRRVDDGAYADRALAAEARRAELDPRARAQATRLAYGAVQRRRTLDWLIDGALDRPAALEPAVRDILRLGAYELAFSDGVPPRAAVDQAVRQARALRGPKARASARAGVVNAVLRRIAAEGPSLLAELDAQGTEAAGVRHSMPDWIARRLIASLGEADAVAVMEASARPAESALRWNPLRGPRAGLEAELPPGLDARRPGARVVRPRGPVRARGLARLGPRPGHGAEPRLAAGGARRGPAAGRARAGPLRRARGEDHPPRRAGPRRRPDHRRRAPPGAGAGAAGAAAPDGRGRRGRGGRRARGAARGRL